MKLVTINKALLLKYSANKEVNIYMPSIKPISDLKNYIDVLKEVDISRRVYLTRNGHAEYGILTMKEIAELDRLKAAYTLTQKLRAAEERAEKEGWIDADDLEREFGGASV